MKTYYIDNYAEGCARKILGPYSSIRAARSTVRRNINHPVRVTVDDSGVIGGAETEIMESWAEAGSCDYMSIYLVRS